MGKRARPCALNAQTGLTCVLALFVAEMGENCIVCASIRWIYLPAWAQEYGKAKESVARTRPPNDKVYI